MLCCVAFVQSAQFAAPGRPRLVHLCAATFLQSGVVDVAQHIVCGTHIAQLTTTPWTGGGLEGWASGTGRGTQMCICQCTCTFPKHCCSLCVLCPVHRTVSAGWCQVGCNRVGWSGWFSLAPSFCLTGRYPPLVDSGAWRGDGIPPEAWRGASRVGGGCFASVCGFGLFDWPCWHAGPLSVADHVGL